VKAEKRINDVIKPHFLIGSQRSIKHIIISVRGTAQAKKYALFETNDHGDSLICNLVMGKFMSLSRPVDINNAIIHNETKVVTHFLRIDLRILQSLSCCISNAIR